jgi:hypothetical protein
VRTRWARLPAPRAGVRAPKTGVQSPDARHYPDPARGDRGTIATVRGSGSSRPRRVTMIRRGIYPQIAQISQIKREEA